MARENSCIMSESLAFYIVYFGYIQFCPCYPEQKSIVILDQEPITTKNYLTKYILRTTPPSDINPFMLSRSQTQP